MTFFVFIGCATAVGFSTPRISAYAQDSGDVAEEGADGAIVPNRTEILNKVQADLLNAITINSSFGVATGTLLRAQFRHSIIEKINFFIFKNCSSGLWRGHHGVGILFGSHFWRPFQPCCHIFSLPHWQLPSFPSTRQRGGSIRRFHFGCWFRLRYHSRCISVVSWS